MSTTRTPRVDFYILPDDSRRSIQNFACRLVEKAYLQGHKILIQTASADESRLLDNLLWTLQDDNFIPHAILDETLGDDQSVVISHNNEDMNDVQLLINLSSRPSMHHAFDRIAEVLNQEQNCKKVGREHYKIYRDSGFELHHHEIKPS